MKQKVEYTVCFSTAVLKKDVFVFGGQKKKGCQSEQVIVFSLCSKKRLNLVW